MKKINKPVLWYKKTPTKNLTLWGWIENGKLELSTSSQLQLMKINLSRLK